MKVPGRAWLGMDTTIVVWHPCPPGMQQEEFACG